MPMRMMPRQTSAVAAQRRRSTFSFRKNCAAAMLVTNPIAEDAGPTKLKFAQFSAVSRLK